jgi:ketol-acid reductoisomerase
LLIKNIKFCIMLLWRSVSQGFMERIITRLDNREELWKFIAEKRIAVIGYGNQGRSQALNMRDSGLSVVIGNVEDGYAERARQEGFEVFSIERATKEADIVFMLIPDEVQPAVFRASVEPYLKRGGSVVFASGYNYFFHTLEVPEHANVLMIAPRMIGFGVRERFLRGQGFPVLIALGRSCTEDAQSQLLALTDAIGALKPGGLAVLSSFREEVLVDLLSEQTWAGALLSFFRAYYEVATELGASPEAVLLELYASGELVEIARSIMDEGLFKQLRNHSHTSQYGQLTRGPIFVDQDVKGTMRQIALKILDGSFAKEWALEQQTGLIHFKKLQEIASEHPMEKEEAKLYRTLGRI